MSMFHSHLVKLNSAISSSKFQGHLESSNFIGGYQNITNYFARHTPTQREYALRDVRLSFYVSSW